MTLSFNNPRSYFYKSNILKNIFYSLNTDLLKKYIENDKRQNNFEISSTHPHKNGTRRL